MGVFSWLFGRRERQDTRLWLDGSGTFSLEVVGEASYQDALERLCGGRTEEGADYTCEACLVEEDSNPYDSVAVRVDIGGRTVGYLSREHARKYREQLKRLGYAGQQIYCAASVRGGWDRGRGNRGHFGVRLDLPVAP